MLPLSLLLVSVKFCDSARILGIVPTPSASHQAAFQPLWSELSLRGHQVTVLTTDPLKNASLTNLTEIDLHFVYEKLQEIENKKPQAQSFFSKFMEGFSDQNHHRLILEMELNHPQVLQQLIKDKSVNFDVVLVEILHPVMYVFAHRFNCPLIQISATEVPGALYENFDNPSQSVLYSNLGLPSPRVLGFTERIMKPLYLLALKLHVAYKIRPDCDSLIRKYFGDGYPPLWDIAKERAAMLFVNVDPVLHFARPLLPTIIQIGGNNAGNRLNPPQLLPEDLKSLLDKSTLGVVYVSLHTNAKKLEIQASTFKIILEAFSELPFKFLWKTADESLQSRSDNIIISKSLPQQDILRHPNVKLFVTEGDWLAIEESLYNHVPILGLPFYSDHWVNMNAIVSKGLALSLDVKTLTKKHLKSSILEVIRDSRYRNRTKELIKVARDTPMGGLEKAVWWTEYVLRHNGTRYLKNPAATDLPFYQYYLLDVTGFFLFVAFSFIYLLFLLLRCLTGRVMHFRRVEKVKLP